MPLNPEAAKPPKHDPVAEMQQKIQLLEGEKSAYYEKSQAAINRNRETILFLRQENKNLHQKLADTLAGDQRVILSAFHNRGAEKDAYRSMSAKTALAVLDQKVLIKMNRLNAMKHTTQTCRIRLRELQLQSRRPKQAGASTSHHDPTSTDKIEDDERQLRLLENSLDKAKMKCQEAEHITRGYIKVKNHLQDESLTFQDRLDGLEADILKLRDEHHNLQVMNTDAQLFTDMAKAELHQQEKVLHKERKVRERIISRYRKQAEESKAQTEKAQRRDPRTPILPEELTTEPQHSPTSLVGEEEETISNFEEAFRRIKEAAGVTDIQEIVERFLSQGETHDHLENMKEENEEILAMLRGERARLQKQFQDLKYFGQSKMSCGKQMQGECEQYLRIEQKRCEAAKERVSWLLKTLHTVHSGVEHLAEKLQHITLDESEVPQLSPDSEEYVVELLVQCEQKLQLLQAELEGRDLGSILKELDDEEFCATIEGKLPESNNCIKLTEEIISEEEESEEDEVEIISREAIKRQSQLIIDSRTKKKPRKKKK